MVLMMESSGLSSPFGWKHSFRLFIQTLKRNFRNYFPVNLVSQGFVTCVVVAVVVVVGRNAT